MPPALTVPVSFQNTTTPVPIATIGHGLDSSTGWFPLTVGPTIVATDASSHTLEPAEDAGATIPSHVTIDSTPATSNLQLALDSESTVEDIATQLGQQQKVSSRSVSAVIFTDNDVADDPRKVVASPELEAVHSEIPAFAGWESISNVSIKVAGVVGTGILWYCKTVIVVRVKGFFLRRLGEAIGRTIIWSAEQIRQTRQGRIGGLLGRPPLNTGVHERRVF